MKVLIFGKGYIGTKFDEFFTEIGIEYKLSSRRIKTKEDVLICIGEYEPTHVLNCIGRTGSPNVDWCEDHKEETFFSNVQIPLWMAEVCESKHIHFTQLSSGCIYDSSESMRVYTEEDMPNYSGSYYSLTKLVCETVLTPYHPLIIRPRIPIAMDGSTKCLITKLKKFDKVVDFPNSATTIPFLLDATFRLMLQDKTGIYNVVNRGYINNIVLSKMLNLGNKIPMTPKELDKITVARRSNVMLSTEKLEKEGIIPPDIYEWVRQNGM